MGLYRCEPMMVIFFFVLILSVFAFSAHGGKESAATCG